MRFVSETRAYEKDFQREERHRYRFIIREELPTVIEMLAADIKAKDQNVSSRHFVIVPALFLRLDEIPRCRYRAGVGNQSSFAYYWAYRDEQQPIVKLT